MLPYFQANDIPWDVERRTALYQNLEIYEVWNGELIGYLVFRELDGRFFLADIQIAAAHRNKGIGRALVEKASGIARSRGYNSVHLKVFKNSPAINLYLRLGYSVIGEEKYVLLLEVNT